MKTTQNNQSRGFTIVEVFIVIAVIALLACVAIPNFLRSRDYGRARSLVVEQFKPNIVKTIKVEYASREQGGKQKECVQLTFTDSMETGHVAIVDRDTMKIIELDGAPYPPPSKQERRAPETSIQPPQ